MKRFLPGNIYFKSFVATLFLLLAASYAKANCNFHAGFTYTFSSTNCKEMIATNTSFVTGASDSGVNYYWNFANLGSSTSKNAGFTFPGNGTYTVCLVMYKQTNTGMCSDTFCTTVTVNCSTSCASLTGSTLNYSVNCATKTISFGAGVTDTTGIRYTWGFGDATYDTLNHKYTSHTYTNYGTYTVCLNIKRYAAGTVCKDTTICKSIALTPCSGCSLGYISFGWNVNCATRVVSLSGYNSDSTGIYKYTWSYGDNSSVDSTNSLSRTHTYNNYGTYNICLNVKKYYTAGGTLCHDTTICRSVTVSPCTNCTFGNVGFNFSVNCSTKVVTYNAFNSDSTGTYKYTWGFGDATYDSSNAMTKAHTYSATGTYNACLKISKYLNGAICKDTVICKSVVVPTCSTGCTVNAYWYPTVNCRTLTATSLILSDTTALYTYFWKFDSTHTATTKNATYTFPANGTYNVCLTIKRYAGTNTSTPCGDTTICRTIVINCTTTSPCGVNAYWYPTVNCRTLTATSLILSDTNALYSYLWRFDSTHTASTKNATFTFPANGTYNVCLTIKRYSSPNTGTPCGDTTICRTVVINCNTNTGCSIYGYFGYTVACPQRNVSFQLYHTDTAAPYVYQWSFGDNSGSTSQNSMKNPTHYYAANGTYTVCVLIKRLIPGTTTVCKDTTICKQVTVNCGCNIQANYSFGVNCSLKKLEVQNTSTGDSCQEFKWSWGDGTYSTAKNPGYHIYSQPGTYTVCLYSHKCGDTTCANTICKTVTIPQTCCNVHAYFGTSVNCSTKKVTVVNYSYGDTCMTYKWSWGDGTYSTDKNPGTHTYTNAGTYNICLIARKCTDSTCVNYICKTVVIPSNCCPVPNFYFYNFCNTFRFMNTTNGGTSYLWSFGDSSWSIARSPIHTFPRRGTYNVCLTVFDSVKHCSATVCKSVYVNCNWWHNAPSGNFEIPDITEGNAESAEQTDISGIQRNENAGITAYPNPTNNYLTILIPDTRSVIRITDATGKMLMQFDNVSKFYKADVSSLAAGVYFINVINEKGTQSVRFMKN